MRLAEEIARARQRVAELDRARGAEVTRIAELDDSYDRLFSSQDQMPKGGFGNLIALPLQKEARRHGNTELLDDELVPFPGEQQWDVLASVRGSIQ